MYLLFLDYTRISLFDKADFSELFFWFQGAIHNQCLPILPQGELFQRVIRRKAIYLYCLSIFFKILCQLTSHTTNQRFEKLCQKVYWPHNCKTMSVV